MELTCIVLESCLYTFAKI